MKGRRTGAERSTEAARTPKAHVPSDSCALACSGEMCSSITILAVPPMESCSTCVRRELRYGTCWFLFCSAETTSPSDDSDLHGPKQTNIRSVASLRKKMDFGTLARDAPNGVPVDVLRLLEALALHLRVRDAFRARQIHQL